MADVRLTATNPEDSSVVPVACNAKGELLLEEPTLASDDYVAVTGDNMTGDLTLGTDKITLDASDGSAVFTGEVTLNDPGIGQINLFNGGYIRTYRGTSTAADSLLELRSNIGGAAVTQMEVLADGSATFAGGACTIFNQGSIKATSLEATDNVFVKAVAGVGALTVINESTNLLEFQVVTGDATKIGYDVSTDPKITLDRSGSAKFAGGKMYVDSGGGFYLGLDDTLDQAPYDSRKISLHADGKAEFASDVVVGSRNKQWMLVEQNGLCHMVEQIRATTADLVAPAVAEYPPLRDVFAELDAIEKALGEVMDKLRMAPPAGWEVWDGSSENS